MAISIRFLAILLCSLSYAAGREFKQRFSLRQPVIQEIREQDDRLTYLQPEGPENREDRAYASRPRYRPQIEERLGRRYEYREHDRDGPRHRDEDTSKISFANGPGRRTEWDIERESAKLREQLEKFQLQRDIEICDNDMKSCKFTPEELVNKILENMDEEDLPGPEDSDDSVAESLPGRKSTRTDSVMPGSTESIHIGSVMPRPGTRSGTSNTCRGFCVKSRATNAYQFSCRKFIYNRRLRFYQRRNLMIKCYQCRRNCNSFHYMS